VRSVEWMDVAKSVDLREFAAGDMMPLLNHKGQEPAGSLYCVTAGHLQPAAAEVLDSPRVEEFVADLRRVCDYVIFDGPPLLTVSDSLPLLTKVDAAVLITRLGATEPSEAAKLRNLLRTAKATVWGAVVIGGKTRNEERYYYYRSRSQQLAGEHRTLVPSSSADRSPWGTSGTRSAGQSGQGRTGREPKSGDGRNSRPLVGWSTQVAFISDLHGNTAALNAVLADIKRRDIRQVHCLGDLVGYGTHPNEVIEVIRDRQIPTILGNHDDAVAFQRADSGCYYSTREAGHLGEVSFQFTLHLVTEQNKSWLQGLPHERVLRMEGQMLHLVHGSPRRINEYLLPDRDERTYRRIAAGEAADILVFGHTHLSWHRQVGGVLFVNVGSVGRPRDGDPRATYTIVELSRGSQPRLEVVKVDYDVEDVARGVVSAGLPAELAESFRRADQTLLPPTA
jgi:putative phosphoesterase